MNASLIMYSVELYANTSRSAKFNSKNYRFKLTSIALANEPFSVSTARQKSSSSDVGTFRRPACCLTVKCQQKGRTKQLISLSNAAHGQTCWFSTSTSRDENWCVVTWRDRRAFGRSTGIAMHAGITGRVSPVPHVYPHSDIFEPATFSFRIQKISHPHVAYSKSNSPVHRHPMVSRFTQVHRARLQ